MKCIPFHYKNRLRTSKTRGRLVSSAGMSIQSLRFCMRLTSLTLSVTLPLQNRERWLVFNFRLYEFVQDFLAADPTCVMLTLLY